MMSNDDVIVSLRITVGTVRKLKALAHHLDVPPEKVIELVLRAAEERGDLDAPTAEPKTLKTLNELKAESRAKRKAQPEKTVGVRRSRTFGAAK